MLNIGIIGSGFGLYGLLPAFYLTSGCKVVAICGRKTERLVSHCKRYGVKNIYSDWQEMLEMQKLDAVAVAVTPSAQYEIARVAIEKGLHIFAEKPLASTSKQAKILLDLAKKKQIKHTVDFIFPEIGEWRKVKQILQARKYGKLRHIALNWDFLSYDIKSKLKSWKTDVSRGGGALSFYFSHSLYYLEYFAGEITDTKSLLSYSKESLNGGEVGVDVLIKFKNGIYGNAHIYCNSKGLNCHQLVFQCQKATIILKNHQTVTHQFTIKIHTLDKTKELIVQKKAVREDEDERVRVVKNLTSRFIKGIIKDEEIEPSFEQGLRVQKLIEKIRTS